MSAWFVPQSPTPGVAAEVTRRLFFESDPGQWQGNAFVYTSVSCQPPRYLGSYNP